MLHQDLCICKSDLHLHLDGSLPYEILPKLYEISNIPMEKDHLKELFTVPEGCTSLEEYLKCFDLPIRLLQTEEALSVAVAGLMEDLSKEQVRHMEIRFAPQFHRQQGLSLEAVVEAAIDGLNKGRAAHPDMTAGLILCMMIGATREENLEVLEVAKKYYKKGVVAVDRAGAERMRDLTLDRELFEKASKLDLPYTIHAGECGSFENIKTAIELGAQRIGHGVAAYADPATVELLVKTQTPIEVCVISNLQTIATPPEIPHPVRSLLNAGVKVTINTDNRTVSGTDLDREYDYMLTKLGMTREDILRCQKNGETSLFEF